jgi:hypothetical protein
MKTQTNDQREILYRLLKRLTDGSYKVVGYEWHQDGRIYHSKDIKNWNHIFKYKVTITRNLKAGTIATVDHNNYIPHDRKDQFTGITLYDTERTKLFERDEIELSYSDDCEVTKHTIKYCAEDDYPAFDLEPHLDVECNGLSHAFLEGKIKITGIEGIINEK